MLYVVPLLHCCLVQVDCCQQVFDDYLPEVFDCCRLVHYSR